MLVHQLAYSYSGDWLHRDMFAQRHVFDGMVAGRDPYVFASEYAVLQDGGWGNLQVCKV